jgi:hypothetical protein
MRADLLLLLADRLDEVPVKQFFYGSWVGSDWGGKADLSCGTTACAGGWATTIPALRKLGLVLDGGGIRFHKVWGFDAMALVFEIDRHEALHLFMPREVGPLSNRATPAVVAQHIRDFVAKKQAEEKASG